MRKFKTISALLTFCLSLLATLAFCQPPSSNQTEKQKEYVQQAEQIRKSALLREMDSGVYYMDKGMHVQADAKFKYILNNLRSVPSDLTFYFGKNSFQLGNYKQAIDWLNKYIQLKGTNGQFSVEAMEWQRKAENEYMREKNQTSQQVEQVLSTSYDIDCGPTGRVTCPVCKGDHVTIKKGPFGDEYRTCKYCNEHGILTCEEYNKLLRGQLKARQ